MARDPAIERRLLNWARAKGGDQAGGLGFASVNLQAEGSQRGYREATIPIDACEADITDQGVRDLRPVLRETVVRLYLRNVAIKDEAMREHVSEGAILARLWKAHYELRAWFNGREAKAAQERQRVEQLRQTAHKR